MSIAEHVSDEARSTDPVYVTGTLDLHQLAVLREIEQDLQESKPMLRILGSQVTFVILRIDQPMPEQYARDKKARRSNVGLIEDDTLCSFDLLEKLARTSTTKLDMLFISVECHTPDDAPDQYFTYTVDYSQHASS